MGSAIECFANAGAIVVPRSRFSPVKTCNELFALRSDAFKVTEAATVELAIPKVPLADRCGFCSSAGACIHHPPRTTRLVCFRRCKLPEGLQRDQVTDLMS